MWDRRLCQRHQGLCELAEHGIPHPRGSPPLSSHQKILVPLLHRYWPHHLLLPQVWRLGCEGPATRYP